MNTESHYLYCAVDSKKSIIKIGISSNPDHRECSLSITRTLKMKIIFMLKMQNKHYENASILYDESNYLVSPQTESSYNYSINLLKRAYKLEKFFKNKFKNKTTDFGNEWFVYEESTLEYIKRRFLLLSKSEETALIRARFIIK